MKAILRYRWLAFWLLVVFLFTRETFSQLDAPHRTIYRVIASAMSVMGALFGAIMGWREFRQLRKESSLK